MKEENLENKIRTVKHPDKIFSYFALEKWSLFIITLSGIIYNVGMIAGPWFEGQLVLRLFDVMGGRRKYVDMIWLALIYVAAISCVQIFRFVKRLYVRKFANYINQDMKQVVYKRLVHMKKKNLWKKDTGELMTKAIADVDTCVEGMRKFTTEIFDTGVVMVAYLVMLAVYDWKLTLLVMIFPPIAYLIAEKLKKVVTKCAIAVKESAGRLSDATLDRVENALTYRTYGQDEHIDSLYEEHLRDYEKKSINANIWETSMQPIYQSIATLSVIFILWFGGKNVLGEGFVEWNIAAFTTFLSCFTKLAIKSSKAAKLFNAVQKASVSWNRVKPILAENGQPQIFDNNKIFDDDNLQHIAGKNENTGHSKEIVIKNLTLGYETGNKLFENITLNAWTGEIIGVTGYVAGGKSSFGRLFLGQDDIDVSKGNANVSGSIHLLNKDVLAGHGDMTAYLGHDPELISATVEENILLGKEEDVWPYLQAVCMDKEVKAMEQGIFTVIGNGGTRLSGGQQARIALARTLCHKNEILVLDDPFSAVDRGTEQQIFENIKPFLVDSVTFIISHRLELFDKMNKVIWISEKDSLVDTHLKLYENNPFYAQVYDLQKGGDCSDEG